MAYTQNDSDRHVNTGILGPGRRVTPGAAAVNNATALSGNGAYLLTCDAGKIYIVGPTAEATVATTNDTPLIAGETIRIVCGSVAAEQFVSVIRDAAGAVFVVAGADPATAASQPPDWT